MAEEKLYEMSLPATIQGCYAVLRELSQQSGSPIYIRDVGIPYQDDGPPTKISVSIGDVMVVGVTSGTITLDKINENRTWVRFYKITEPDKYVGVLVMGDPDKQAAVDKAIANAQEQVDAAHDSFRQRIEELKMVD